MKIINKRIDLLETIFKCIYIFHLIFAFTCFGAGNSITSTLTLFLGGILILYRVINYKKYIQVKGEKLLLIFLVSYIISFMIFYKYGIFDEIKALIWMTIQFILLYAIDINKGIEKIKKEMNYILITIISTVTVMNLINVILLISNYSSYYTALDGNVYILGIANWGRLYGITVDPNYVSVVSIVAMIASMYLFKECKNIFLKIILTISVVLQFIFIAFAQSRTAVVTLISGILCYYILKMVCSFKEQRNIKIIFKMFLKMICGSIMVIVMMKILISGYNVLMNYTIEETNPAVKIEEIEKTEKIEKVEEIKTEKQPIEIKREETIEGDISNRRFDIWYSGYEIFQKHPIIGIGFGHFAEYALEECPATYIVNNDLAIFSAFHNTIIDVLVSQGIVGIIILVCFVVIIIKELFKITNLSGKNREIIIMLTTICTTIACSAMFLSHVFYVNTPSTAMFWLFLGYMIYFLNKKESEI